VITSSTRVSDALRQRPDLLQILPAFHPAFARLAHPILGKILPRLVTVADAARIAGVDPDVLVSVMNLPPGAPLPEAKGTLHDVVPEPTWLDGVTARILDVRPKLEAGEDPLSVILAAIRALDPGEVLTVIAPFEPVPLIGLLGRQGWSHHTAWEGDVCRTSFGHRGEAAPEAHIEAEVVPDGAGFSIDVRQLEPPEPMRQVIAALDAGKLPLRVVHHREPALLYPKLTERGLTWEVAVTGDHVEINIHAR
jgi:uncharacterized protein (DUF2249 family)